MPPIKLGDLLLKARAITDSQLRSALSEQQKWGGRLGEILVRMNILTEEMLVKALSKQLALPAVNLDSVQGIPAHVRGKIPAQLAKDFAAVPVQLRDDGKTLVVAMAEPQNIEHIDTMRSVARCRIVVQVAGRSAIARAYRRFYEGVDEGADLEGSFKVVDASGNTVIRTTEEVLKGAPATKARAEAAPSPAGKAPGEILSAIEEGQRREVAALKAMVELLIEKGVFTRDEYLARLKR
jgi:hypothetical protein